MGHAHRPYYPGIRHPSHRLRSRLSFHSDPHCGFVQPGRSIPGSDHTPPAPCISRKSSSTPKVRFPISPVCAKIVAMGGLTSSEAYPVSRGVHGRLRIPAFQAIDPDRAFKGLLHQVRGEVKAMQQTHRPPYISMHRSMITGTPPQGTNPSRPQQLHSELPEHHLGPNPAQQNVSAKKLEPLSYRFASGSLSVRLDTQDSRDDPCARPPPGNAAT
ncbi:hypothetical protein FA13DRAFT_971181 [Coprinellus micaceus]|uniref:Uncharacterized protein n=1 Tax=Coprinellus micaceus TaxID=71717 RepID=A0A4Y7SZF9_COPMI|nr:hypothetical protein FA13DRAFT_971181 [Coprinellus micaceus]